MRRASAGFTLLEVLVALAVLGLGLTALTRASAVVPARVDALWARGLAEMVAQDLLSEVALGLRAPSGPEARGERQLAGRRFGFELTLQNGESIRVEVGLYPRVNGLAMSQHPWVVQSP